MTFKTNYSFRQATGSPESVVEKLQSFGYDIAPIADINSTFGFLSWKKACNKYNIKPVYGASIFVSPDINAKKPIIDLWTFYAIDDVKSINDLVTLATSQFRYNPLLTYEQAINAQGVIKIAGYKCQEVVKSFDGAKEVYFPLSAQTSKGYIKRYPFSDWKYIHFQDNRYVSETDELAWEVTVGRNSSLQTYPQHILSTDEWKNSISKLNVPEYIIQRSLENFETVLKSCNADLKTGDIIRPEKELSLREMCIEGAKRIGVDLSDPVYNDRLNEELKVISDKSFDDYFILMADLIQWAKKTQLVGPGRGSSAGSLVCYLLNITEVDPIKYKLLFFRFLDPARTDWPDIDTDFSDRDAAVEYIINKYGSNRAAKLGTIANWQNKNSSNEVCKALDINRFDAQKVLDSIPNYAANDKRNETALKSILKTDQIGISFLNRHPNFEVVTAMVGMPSHSGQHASGVIVTQDEITNYVAIDSRTQSTMCDLHDAEELGLIKIDVLGLKTLKVLDSALKLAGKSHDYLRNVDLNDQKAFDILNDGKFLGVFQFEGDALRRLTKTMRVDNFDDLAILSALSRPGAAVGADTWVRRKMGQEPVSYVHPSLEPYMKDTLGTLVYQETVMQIAHYVAGMSWPQVIKLRKAIGKSMGAEAMAEHAEPFISGLVNAGLNKDDAEKFWSDVLAFGAYAFNLSHSVSYGFISYWTCYMKAYHPVEFAAAALTLENDHEKQLELLRELSQEGVDYIPVDPEHSTDKWNVVNGKLVGPLTLIDGIGPKMVSQILSSRARNEPLPDRAKKLLSNFTTKIDTLWPIKDAISAIDFNSINVQSVPTPIEKLEPNGEWQEDIVLMGLATKIVLRSENEPSRIQDRLDRGQRGKVTGEHRFIEIRLSSDLGEVYAKVGVKEFAANEPILFSEDVEEGKTLIMVKGTITPEIRMILVKRLKVIGKI